VTVYPNPVPSGGVLTINVAPPTSDIFVELTNALGQVVMKQSFPPRQLFRFDMRDLAAGFYLVHVRSDTWQATRGFVVLK
jgi:hypothetical protein